MLYSVVTEPFFLQYHILYQYLIQESILIRSSLPQPTLPAQCYNTDVLRPYNVDVFKLVLFQLAVNGNYDRYIWTVICVT